MDVFSFFFVVLWFLFRRCGIVGRWIVGVVGALDLCLEKKGER